MVSGVGFSYIITITVIGYGHNPIMNCSLVDLVGTGSIRFVNKSLKEMGLFLVQIHITLSKRVFVYIRVYALVPQMLVIVFFELLPLVQIHRVHFSQ